ncbi:ankyrin [Ascodesmis nigricans]|uniref:Ankyrin n=1 Tax=Ascodesmis nigricans TaxID=341454 RepID=A0A4S2MN12_9PEZI|nr:ankyrin [Ascodesmis nigricans]
MCNQIEDAPTALDTSPTSTLNSEPLTGSPSTIHHITSLPRPASPKSPVVTVEPPPSISTPAPSLDKLPNELLYLIADHLFPQPDDWGSSTGLKCTHHDPTNTRPSLTYALLPLYNFSLTCTRFEAIGVLRFFHNYKIHNCNPSILYWILSENRATFSIIRALLANGISANEDNPYRMPPLHAAIIYYPSTAIIRILIENGAELGPNSWKPGSFTSLHFSALHLAILHRRLGGAREILAAGAKVDCLDSELNTPLHYAVQIANIPCALEMVKLLLKYKANVVAMNKAGKTPVEVAARRGEEGKEVLWCLLKTDISAIEVYRNAVEKGEVRPVSMLGVMRTETERTATEPEWKTIVGYELSDEKKWVPRTEIIKLSPRVKYKDRWRMVNHLQNGFRHHYCI